jgi:hypothetical protein
VEKLSITVVAIAPPDCINPTLIGGELIVATGRARAGERATYRGARVLPVSSSGCH